jgi:hypothetical protein
MKSNSHLDESLEAVIQELTDVELEKVFGGIVTLATLTEGWGLLVKEADWISDLSEKFKSFPNISYEPYDRRATTSVEDNVI